MLGVVYEFPVPKGVPPVETENQLMVPIDGVAPKITAPAPQVAEGAVAVMVGMAFIVAVTAVRLTVVHPYEVAST
jgi:hypothetical protein